LKAEESTSAGAHRGCAILGGMVELAHRRAGIGAAVVITVAALSLSFSARGIPAMRPRTIRSSGLPKPGPGGRFASTVANYTKGRQSSWKSWMNS